MRRVEDPSTTLAQRTKRKPVAQWPPLAGAVAQGSKPRGWILAHKFCTKYAEG
jgi:hypothetical protein